MRLRAKTILTKAPSIPMAALAASTPPASEQPLSPQLLFMLPSTISSQARFISAPNAVTGASNRYVLCPQTGFYELTRVAAPKDRCRSWLLVRSSDRNFGAKAVPAGEPRSLGIESSVIQAPVYYVATPLDPLFLLLPVLSSSGGNTEFLAISDYLTRFLNYAPETRLLTASIDSKALMRRLEQRIHAVCDAIDLGNECMYALAIPKLLRELISKARKCTKPQFFPRSVHEQYVKASLEELPPAASSLNEGTTATSFNGTTLGPTAQLDVSIANAHSSKEAYGDDTTLKTISELARLRTSLDFIFNLYVPAGLRSKLNDHLRESNPAIVDFAPLDKHIQCLAQSREQARALQSLSDNISRKRGPADNDDDRSSSMEMKKRKRDAEEEKKKITPAGIKQLAKADISGMKKLSAFFTKNTSSQLMKN